MNFAVKLAFDWVIGACDVLIRALDETGNQDAAHRVGEIQLDLRSLAREVGKRSE